MRFDFGEVLGRTWKIGWNYKVLWLWQMLRVLAVIVFMPFFITSMTGSFNELVTKPWASTLLSFVAFLYTISFTFLTVIIQLTTTYGVVKVEKGAEKLAFGELFRESLPYFWRVLGLYMLFGGAGMVIWFGFMSVFFAGSMLAAGLASICFFPFFLLSIPVLLVAYSVLELAQAGIVANNMRTLEAITHSWKLFRANWLGIILLMLILYIAMSILSSLLVLPVVFPMAIFMRGMVSPDNINTSASIPFLVVFSLVFILINLVVGILMAFFQSAWAITYLRLNKNISVSAAAIELSS